MSDRELRAGIRALEMAAHADFLAREDRLRVIRAMATTLSEDDLSAVAKHLQEIGKRRAREHALERLKPGSVWVAAVGGRLRYVIVQKWMNPDPDRLPVLALPTASSGSYVESQLYPSTARLEAFSYQTHSPRAESNDPELIAAYDPLESLPREAGAVRPIHIWRDSYTGGGRR